ncbi:DNA-binding transcriptional regulator, AcrR family [Pedobacter steynii]|uniref:DNA-binding transcriptional regulator, AcrR family n=1 Tax=Pedobacter steynii TaxID=430522 RepID=A0A1H0CVB6_9SPHI|nr:TetR/AcrR family transcriptional regulator [Pedobacter steynii]NQX41675.1 TetR/AcrR family transcriptional regulator [Pedobacter steynii]SDN61795.1 DNA-binding transcriptional regulator, AcrR family [Pedobacter steynii]
MGSKERIQRLKEETRLNILDAALEIVKEDGWQSLSMRKIADKIEYTAPIIYEYFANKEGILLELTRKGYIILLQELKAEKNKHTLPEDQLEGMWLAYWNFAFKYKELYQLMYGVDMNCCEMMKAFPEAEGTTNIICDTIKALMTADPINDDLVCRKYFTFWSVVHGLISINFVRKGTDNETNQHILRDALKGIIKYIND